MAILGGQLAYSALMRLAPPSRYQKPDVVAADEDAPNDLALFFGDQFFELIRDKVVVDFGCGDGIQSVEMARSGAARVYGIDIQASRLERGRGRAERFGVAGNCEFAERFEGKADIVISKDAFEHFADPAAILRLMSTYLKPGGMVLASFGPTWLHPYGGHLFSIFPWSHLLFTEAAQIRWRSEFKDDGATCFSECDGGLNQLTIRQFERYVEHSPFTLSWLDTVPIKGFQMFKLRPFREFGSSIVRCKLELT